MSTRSRGSAHTYHADPERLMTADDLLYRNPLPDARTELIEGRLLVREPPTFRHGDVTGRLLLAMGMHLEHARLARGAGRRSGRLVCNDTGFILRRGPDTVRASDIAYVREERVPADVDCYLEMGPDLAVEVLSPSDRPGYVRVKLQHWQAAGCRHVWIVSPRRRSFIAHDDDIVTTLGADETFDGGPLFPGHQLDVGSLFS